MHRGIWLRLGVLFILASGLQPVLAIGVLPVFSTTTAHVKAATPHAPASETSEHDEEQGGGHGSGMTHKMMILVLQLAVILLLARTVGELFERYLRQPAVIGELLTGVAIGPYALGPYISIFGSGPLFPLIESGFPVSPELYGIATIASVVLLFMVGLETDFKQFVRYAGPGAAVGVGGVLGSFITGDLVYVLWTGDSFMSPSALFMGTVSTATSVGITARVLSEKKQLDSPEGTTILAGAVIDDVLGILILAVVGGVAALSQGQNGTEEIAWGPIAIIALKAFGFWIVATALGIALSSKIARFFLLFKKSGSTVALGLGLAFLVAGVSESFGLAMIIGAYVMGLSLSRETVSQIIERRLMPIYACFVPVFFAVMGMLVNLPAMGEAFIFGLIYTVVAIVSKVIGSGLPCYFVGFNTLGAARIGLGMLPRGEVALIVAGVGASQGYVGADMFGVVIMMTLITTLIAPPGLIWLFRLPGEGVKTTQTSEIKKTRKMITIQSVTWRNHELLLDCLRHAFQEYGFDFIEENKASGNFLITGTLEERKVKILLEDLKDRLNLKIRTGNRFHLDIKRIVMKAYEEAQRRISNLEVREEDLEVDEPEASS